MRCGNLCGDDETGETRVVRVVDSKQAEMQSVQPGCVRVTERIEER